MKRILRAVKEVIKGKPFKLRSPKWDDVRDAFIKKNKTCAACGSDDCLQVHHIIPFHVDPSKELDVNNLIVLCENKTKCHLKIGHLGSWRKFNPNVIEDAAHLLKTQKKNK